MNSLFFFFFNFLCPPTKLLQQLLLVWALPGWSYSSGFCVYNTLSLGWRTRGPSPGWRSFPVPTYSEPDEILLHSWWPTVGIVDSDQNFSYYLIHHLKSFESQVISFISESKLNTNQNTRKKLGISLYVTLHGKVSISSFADTGRQVQYTCPAEACLGLLKPPNGLGAVTPTRLLFYSLILKYTCR